MTRLAGMRRVRIIIEGNVQGVAFRAAMAKQAKAAGVYGWVRNLADGRVEAVLEGSDHAVNRLLTWSHVGPSAAKVASVAVEEQRAQGNATSFEVRPDAGGPEVSAPKPGTPAQRPVDEAAEPDAGKDDAPQRRSDATGAGPKRR